MATVDVLIVGAGAIGAYFGACLQRGGRKVAHIARGANLQALRTDGIRVTGARGTFETGPVEASDDPGSLPDAGIALLCVKNYDLEGVCEGVAGRASLYVTLQNGVDAPEVAAHLLGDVVLAGSTGIVADLAGPGHVHLTSDYAWIAFGERDGAGVSDRARRALEVLEVDGIEPRTVDDARVALWEKMALMCGMAGLTTLHNKPMGEILADEELAATFRQIVTECFEVASASGVALPEEFVDKRMHYAGRIDPEAMSSMSRDFQRGRRIELETFNGAVVRFGREFGIEVPANRSVYDAIAAKVQALGNGGR